MRDLTAESFFANDPRRLRVAARVDDAVRRLPGAPQIRLDIEAPSTRPRCYQFALDPIDQRAAGEPSLEPATTHRTWYAFALSPDGIAAFDRARREIRTKALEGTTVSMNIHITDSSMPAPSATSMKLRIDVALAAKDGYFTLIKETDVPVARAERAADPDVAKLKTSCVPA